MPDVNGDPPNSSRDSLRHLSPSSKPQSAHLRPPLLLHERPDFPGAGVRHDVRLHSAELELHVQWALLALLRTCCCVQRETVPVTSTLPIAPVLRIDPVLLSTTGIFSSRGIPRRSKVPGCAGAPVGPTTWITAVPLHHWFAPSAKPANPAGRTEEPAVPFREGSHTKSADCRPPGRVPQSSGGAALNEIRPAQPQVKPKLPGW